MVLNVTVGFDPKKKKEQYVKVRVSDKQAQEMLQEAFSGRSYTEARKLVKQWTGRSDQKIHNK